MFWEVREWANSNCSLGARLISVCLSASFSFMEPQNSLQPCCPLGRTTGYKECESSKDDLLAPVSPRHQKPDPEPVEGNAHISSKLGVRWDFLLFFFVWETEGWGRGEGYLPSQVGLQIWKQGWKMVILEMDWWVWDATVNSPFLGVWEVLSVQDFS